MFKLPRWQCLLLCTPTPRYRRVQPCRTNRQNAKPRYPPAPTPLLDINDQQRVFALPPLHNLATLPALFSENHAFTAALQLVTPCNRCLYVPPRFGANNSNQHLDLNSWLKRYAPDFILVGDDRAEVVTAVRLAVLTKCRRGAALITTSHKVDDVRPMPLAKLLDVLIPARLSMQAMDLHELLTNALAAAGILHALQRTGTNGIQ